MRISGFASGMDIDQMVKDLMKAESMPLQRMQQEKQTLEWKRDDYRSINTLLLDFRSTLTDMRMTTSYRARETSSTNENLVSATASSAASQSSFSLSEVSQLASSATWVNEGKISDSNIDPTKGMYAQDAFTGNFEWQQGAIFKETVTATSNNQTIAIDSTTGNVQTDAVNVQINGKGFEVVTEEVLAGEPLAANQALLKDGELTFADGVLKADDKVSVQFVTDGQKNDSVELASAAKAFQLSGGSISTENFQLTVDAVNYTIGPASQNENEYSLIDENSNSIGTFNVNTGRITFTDEQPEGTVIDAKYQQNYAAFSVGAETSKGTTYQNFLVTGNESLNQVINHVNSANIGVSMMYDSFSDKMSMRRTETGKFSETGQDMKISGSFMSDALQFNVATNYTEGKNAIFTINGLETERNTNNFQIDGVTFNLKQTFAAADGPVTVGVTNDSDAVFENIKKFVETYNTLIDEINGKVTEEYHRDYKPLTDDQRESLSEKQQEDWEKMAKSGLLRRDTMLQGALSTMRTDFYSPVNNGESAGSFNQLAQIGITTTKNYMSGGKLEINEAKLKEAIEGDPAGVENLFRGDGEGYGEKGIARRLTDSVNSTMDSIYERAGRATATNQQFTIGRNLNDVEEQIQRFQDRLTQIEDRYWRQFTVMEKAMQQANQQASYMMQQFGGMGMQ